MENVNTIKPVHNCEALPPDHRIMMLSPPHGWMLFVFPTEKNKSLYRAGSLKNKWFDGLNCCPYCCEKLRNPLQTGEIIEIDDEGKLRRGRAG